MFALLLDSLEIKGYRCFEDLQVKKLGRVNLIVGKNNVGKTAFLEALWLFASRGAEGQIFEILRERNEIPPYQNGNTLVQPETSRGLRNLFYGRPSLSYRSDELPDHLAENQEFYVGPILKDRIKAVPVTQGFKVTAIPPQSNSQDSIPTTRTEPTFPRKTSNYFIKPNGLSSEKLVEFWDNIEKWVLEDSVLTALRVIAPDLVDIRFSGYPTGSFARVPVVRLRQAKERVPLRSLGEGMTRLLGIACALINCENGILLIDEIETGLHYSILPDVWKLIFQTASDLNIQVFTTTHSKDCVKAFAAAAALSTEEGILIRLERHDNTIVAKEIEEEVLVDAVNYEVEVR
jgi:ABC-type branched-subunit amino acid transport system ATPase component